MKSIVLFVISNEALGPALSRVDGVEVIVVCLYVQRIGAVSQLDHWQSTVVVVKVIRVIDADLSRILMFLEHRLSVLLLKLLHLG